MRPRQISFSVSGAANAAASAAALYDYQTASPVAAGTVIMNDTPIDGLLYLTPAGSLATLTVTLPTNANSRLGQTRRLSTTQDIVLLTVNVAGGTILNNPTTLSANSSLAFQKVAANTWMRIA
jgi:hypothetical protein